eukprot:gene6816-10981_t
MSSTAESITKEEVERHNKEIDAWIIIHNKVYDITKFISQHPGGLLILTNVGGDSTDSFLKFGHGTKAKKLLQQFYIGELFDEGGDQDELVPEPVDFRELLQESRIKTTDFVDMRSFLQETRVEVEKVDLSKMLQDSRVPREQITFDEIKKHKIEFTKFRKHCKNEETDHLIQFVLDVHSLKEKEDFKHEWLVKIFEDYVSPITSENPIQFSHNTFALIIMKYKKKDETAFDKAQQEISREIIKNFIKWKDPSKITKKKEKKKIAFDELLLDPIVEETKIVKELEKKYSFTQSPKQLQITKESSKLIDIRHSNESKSYSNPLVNSIIDDNEQKVKEILMEKPDLANQQFFDQSLLHLAICYSNEKIVGHLITAGAHINSGDKLKRTPLHIAANMGNTNIVLNLLGNGANVNVKDLYGFSPIMLSIKQHHWEISENLILFGADLNFKKDNGLTILHESLQYGDEECLDWILKKEKIKLNGKDQMGQTPLLRSLERSPISLIKKYMEVKGVDILATDNNSKNLFHFATRNQRNDFLEFILEKDDISPFENLITQKEKLSGQNPLHFAIRYGNLTTVRLMISLFQKVNADILSKDGSNELPSGIAHKTVDKMFNDYISSNDYVHLDRINSKIEHLLRIRKYFREVEKNIIPSGKKSRSNSKKRSSSTLFNF